MFDWVAAVPPLVLVVVVLVVVTLESLGIPLPGETVLVTSVLVAGVAGINPWWLAAAAAIGAILGDTIGYAIGHRFGVRLLELGSRIAPRTFSIDRIGAAAELMRKYGAWAVFFGRFIALLRILAGPLAGTLRMPYRKFFVANATGGIVWAVTVTALVSVLGAAAEELIHRASWLLLALVLVAVFVTVILLVRGRIKRSRGGAVERPTSLTAAEFEALLQVERIAAGDAVDRASGEERAPLTESVVLVARGTWSKVKRVPFTVAVTVALLLVGIGSGSPTRDVWNEAWFGWVAYGLPSFEQGFWWTPLTGTFFVLEPLHFGLVLGTAIVSLGWLERVRGTAVTVAWFVIGQVSAAVVTTLILAVIDDVGWPWAHGLAQTIDVGPSGGVFAVLAVAVTTLRPPWRARASGTLFAVVLVMLLFSGTLADVEHFVAVSIVLLVKLPEIARTPSVREWRLLAFGGLIVLGVTQLIVAVAPTSGPLGSTTPGHAPWIDIAIDIVIVLLIANGVRLGRRIAWAIAMIAAVVNVLWALLLLGVLDELADDLSGVALSITTSALWLVVGVILIAGRHAFRVPMSKRRRLVGVTTATANMNPENLYRTALKTHGGRALSWMGTWRENRWFETSGGESVIPFQQHAGIAVTLGDPIGPLEHRTEAIVEFAKQSDAAGLIPCLFSVGVDTADRIPDGWRAIRVAEDTLIDLPGLEFTGKTWQPSRGAINRAKREGITMRMTTLMNEHWAVLVQVREISEDWVGEKGLPEMHFTLGGVDEALDPEVRVALALDVNGKVHGVLSWLPVYGPADGPEPAIRGWTLDLMRRRDGGFGPVIEYLISESALTFRDEGAEWLSLSGAPLASSGSADVSVNDPEIDDDPAANLIVGVLNGLGAMLEPLYGFRSLHRFKQKFNPRHEAMYLVYRDEGELPGIAKGLTKAFLPTARTADYVRAGVALVKR